jgi:hypothetical protein
MLSAGQFLLSALIGVLSSMMASLVVWLLLFRVRPKIDISPVIARTTGPNGEISFRVKIVNKTRRPAIDLQASIYLDTLRKVPNGDVHMLHKLPLKSTAGFMLHGYNKKDSDARYARRLLIEDDIDATWLDDQHASIVMRLFARDGMSGAFQQCEQIYRLKREIKDGSFHWGDSFEVS